MKFKSSFFILFLLLFSSQIFSQSTYFIKYKSSISKARVNNEIINQKLELKTLQKSTNLTGYKLSHFAKGLFKENEKFGRIVKVDFDSSIDTTTAVSILQNDPDIEYVQKANSYNLDYTPNDSLISQQWALNKINAFDAWNITQGTDTVLLGIIDTGIDYNHPDLKNKIFLNPGEIGIDNHGRDKRTNGVDDDGNGGVEFNLRDRDGRQLSSGIYFYRVVQLDDQHNEGEEKFGKFAIIR